MLVIVTTVVVVDVSVDVIVESADTVGVSVSVMVSVGCVMYAVDVGFSMSVLTPLRVVAASSVVVVVL